MRASPECASDLVFDRHAAGELSAAEEKALAAHLAGCERCRARSAALADEAARFDATPPPWLGKPRRSSLRWLPAAGGTIALAAALLLWARARNEGPTERLKGTAHIGYHVQHDGAVRAGTDADRLNAGDGVQFTYSSRAATHLAVLSVDGAQRVSTYFPSAGDQATALPAGREVSLPESTRLDDTPGAETVYALFCDTAIAIAPVRQALADKPGVPPAVTGCTVDRVRWEKLAP